MRKIMSESRYSQRVGTAKYLLILQVKEIGRLFIYRHLV
jgi:hypothetical protein